MPFWLSNAAQPLQSFMHEVTSGLANMYVYLDDILVASYPQRKHFTNLRVPLDRLNNPGVTINASKRELVKPSITY